MQNTAYEMRISDWISDVCSSDRFAPLLVEPLFVIGPAERNGIGAYGLHDLEDLPLILPSRPNALRLLIDQIAVDRKLSLNVVREGDSMMTTQALVRRG